MNDTQQILAAYEKAQMNKEASVLATVTFVDGSSYRRPGARMLITESGEMIGCVSGGCLERDLLKKASFILTKNKAEVLTYDTREDTDEKTEQKNVERIGAGLGCNGFIEILLEPILSGTKHALLEKMKQWSADDQIGGILLFPEHPEDGFWSWSKNVFSYQANSPDALPMPVESILENLQNDAIEIFQKNKTVGKSFTGDGRSERVLIETFTPPLQMTIFGAGYDAVAMASLAVGLGHDVRVVDLRSTVPVPRGAFRGVSAYIQCEPHEIPTEVLLNDRSFVILMTHQSDDDLAALPHVLKARPRYVGLLGPRVRGQMLLEEARKKGVPISEPEIENVFFPVGLDIGAETPSEIALSVLAEMNAISRERSGGSLRDRTAPIHLRGVS